MLIQSGDMLSTSYCIAAEILSTEFHSECCFSHSIFLISDQFSAWEFLAPLDWRDWSWKKSLLSVLYSANSFSDHSRTKIFPLFFLISKIFDVATPILPPRKLRSPKNNYWVLFLSAKSISDHFNTQFLSQQILKSIQVFSSFCLPIL